jgi:hypothetical protein
MFKIYKKIDIYLNDEYLCSTNASKTCKEAVSKIRDKGVITVASIPNKTYVIKPSDKLKGLFDKR